MYAEYIAKIKGDISALDKTIREAQGKIQRLNDDEVLIKFNYDGNAKAFNKAFQSILNKHPELSVQLQYDLNKKFLDQKMAELSELEAIKMKMDPSDIEGELTDVNKRIEKTRANIEMINDELKRLSSSNPDLGLEKQLANAQSGAQDAVDSFEKVESSVTETHKALDGLYDNFKQFFQLKGGKDVSAFWERLKYAIDAGDEELKELLADWKLLNEEGSLSPITNGGVNSGGVLGTENVLIARTNSKDKEGKSLYSRTNQLKKSLDEAYASGVNVARILDIIGDEKSEVFFEIQSKASGNTLGSYGLTNDNIPSINPEFLQATDEQVVKLYQDIKKLNDLGVGVDINPENIMYDKEKGFSLIDLDLKPAAYKDQAEMIEDILSGTVRTIHDFYEDLGDSAGMNAAQQFEDRMLSVAKSFEEIDQAANKSIKSTQQSNSPAREGKSRGNDLGEGYADGIRESIPEVEKAASDMTQAALDAVSGSSDKASTIKDFFSLYGDVSTALNNGVAANLDEFKSIFGDLFSKDISELSEKEINVQFAKDLLQQLDLSEDKLAVVKSLLQDIENIQPGGVAEKAVTDTQRAAIILEDVEKIFKIANGSYIVSEEDVRNANEILNASQKNAGNNATNNPYESIESYSREAEQAVSAVTDSIREEGMVADTSAEQKEAFAAANRDVAQSAKESEQAEENLIRLFEESSGQYSFIENLASAEKELSNAMDDVTASAKQATDQIEGQLGLDFSNIGNTPQNPNFSAVRDLAMQQEIEDAQKRYKASVEATTTAILEQTNAERVLDGYNNAFAQTVADAYSQYEEELTKANVKTKELETSLREVINITREADSAGSSLTLLGNLQEEVRASDAAKESLEKLLKTVSGLEDTNKYTSDFVNNVYQVRASIEQLSHEDIITPEQVTQLRVAVDELQKASKLDVNKTFKELSRTKYLDQISQYLSRYTGLSKETRREIEGIADAMKKANSAGELKDLYGQFVKLKTGARDAGEEVQSVFTNINHRLNDMNAKFIAQFFSWQDLIRYARQAVDVINELDYALVDLKKTTTMSSSELKDFYYAANDVAKANGVTTKEIIDQASAWSRLGYSSKEAATEMAALSSQFAAISPGMNLDQATDGLVSTMKAFHIDVADVEREAMDSINRIGNTMATSNDEVVEMLKRSSAAMAAANNTLGETIALESAAVQITRNAETTGTAFRTISMRIRGYSEETEEYIGGVEELSGKIADLTKTAKTPGGISLFTDETKTTYKSTYEILKDIAEIYHDLSDADQAALLEALAGKRGGQVLAGILDDFSEVERAMDEIRNSAGSADAEMSIVEESITYKLNNLQQTWVGILQELIDNGMLGQLIDALTAISEVLGEIITTIGPVGTIVAGLGIKQLIVDADKLPQVLKTITSLISAAESANKVVTFANASDATAEVLLNLEGISDVFGSVTESAEGTAEAVGAIGKTAGGPAVSGATKLAGAFKALVPILTNPITIMAALAVATYALYKYVDGANDRQRDKINDLQKEYNSLSREFDNTNSELERTNKQIDEIQSKGTISLVEQQELERLRTQAELLKIAKQEQEELLKLKAQEVTTENKKLFDNIYGDISAEEITNPEERIQGYDQTVNGQTKFSYGEQLSSALKSASEGDYNDSPNELLAIYQQIQDAREDALKTIQEYESATRELNEEEKAALEGAKEVIFDTDQYMSGLEIQIGKVKTELLNMKQSAQQAGTDDANELLTQINNALKLVYQYSGTSKEWNAMQIGSIFDNDELELTKQELEALASSGELSEDTLKQYPKLAESIKGLDLILGDGETAFSLFKNEMLASAEAAKQVDENLGEALETAKSWESERDLALEKLGLAKEGRDGIEYDDSWTNYLETIKALNPEIAENEKEVEKCALANLQFSHAVDDLSKNFKTYKEALKDADTLTPEFSDTINALADDLTYLTGINFSITEAADFLGEAENIELLEKALNGSDEALQKLQERAAEGVKIKVNAEDVQDLKSYVENRLKELGEGGTVNLNLRPKIDSQKLVDAGYADAAGEEYATVFTTAFDNGLKGKNKVAINFTPIMVDPKTGEFLGVMAKDEFNEYCYDVVDGAEDYLHLQIGAEFHGEDAIEQAKAAAEEIHNLHQIQIELGLSTDEFSTQLNSLLDWLDTADLGTLEAQTYLNEDPFIQALLDLAKQSEEMAAKIKAIFAQLGWDIEWDTTKMKVPKAGANNVSSIYAPSEVRKQYANGGYGAVHWEYEEMDVPTNIRFVGKNSSYTGGRRTGNSRYTPSSLSPAQKSGAKSNVDKANGGGGSNNKDDFKEFYDYFERMIKVLDKQIDLLDAHLQDVVGSYAKNTLLNAEEDLIQSKMNGYASAIDMYSQKASEALSKIPSDIAAKLVNGAVAIDEFVGEGNEEVYKAIQEYEQWSDKVWDCKQQIVELREAIRQLELQKFNNVMKDFTDQFDLRQSAGIDLISKQIALLKEAGELIGESFYQKQLDQANKQLQILTNEQAALVAQMNEALQKGIRAGDDEWLEMVNALTDVEGKILDCKKSIEEFDNALLALHTEVFNRIQDQFAAFNNELANMYDLIADDSLPVATVDNEWTTEGLSQLGLLTQQYELARYQVEQFNDEINKLNQDYLAGRYSATEYADALIDLKERQWDAVNASEAAKESIVDLNKARVDIVVEGIEDEIEAYRKLIEAQKDALQAEQDLHEYRKQIAESNKAITDLERQLAAMADDDTAATIAKRKKLEEQLAEAREALDEQEYSHSIDSQQDALDQQLTSYEELRQKEIDALQESLLNEELIIAESFERVRANSQLIGETILATAQQHGIEMSQALTDSWFAGENAIAHYGELLTAATSQFIGNIMGVEFQTWELQEQANQTAEGLANMFATRADNLVQQLTDSYMSEDNLRAMTDALGDALTNTIDGSYSGAGAAAALDSIADAANGVASAAENAASALRSMMDAQAAANEQPKEHVTTIYGGPNAGKVAVWTERNGSYTFRAKGSKSIPHDEIAWTQENGPEMILSPTSGAILTPLQKGDMVLPTDQTSNIWEWSKFDPTDFARRLIQSVPNTGGNVQTNTMQVGSVVTINGPVNDTMEMVKIASTTAATKIKQSFNELSNGLNK